MLKRLTERDENKPQIIHTICENCILNGNHCTGWDCAQVLARRLAEYEDGNLFTLEEIWEYYAWDHLGDEEYKKNFRANYEACGFCFSDFLQKIESKFGPIMPKHTAIEMHGDIMSPNQTGHEVLVCHQVNCMGVMGEGLAKQLRDLFPKMYLSYKTTCDRTSDKHTLLGQIDTYPVNYNGYDYTIVSIFGQERYGRSGCFTDYDALRKAFQTIRSLASPLPARPATRVRIPYRIGCGLAGGDWNIVKSLIQEELLDHNIIVEIWEKD